MILSEREWGEQEGSERGKKEWGKQGEQEGASWEGPLAQQSWWASQNLPPQVVGIQNILLDHHHSLPLLSQLWVREASWKWGEGLLVQEKWWALQKLEPQVVGTPKHTIWCPLPATSAWSIGSEGSELGARGASLAPTEVVSTPKLAPTGSGVPKHTPWSPLLPTFIGPLGVRGASWERGEELLVQEKWWAPQKLAPQVVRTPKHTIWCPLPTTSAWSTGSEGSNFWARRASLGPTEVVSTPELAPQVVGSQNIPLDLHYPLPPLVHWEWGEQAESKGRDPWSKRSGGHLKNWPHSWWGPQNIPFDVHYPLPLLGPLGVRGASWEQGEQALAQQRLLAPQNLPPQVVGPKNIPLDLHYPLPPSLPVAPLAPPHPLNLPEPLGPSWGLRKPWEPSEAFGSLGSSVRLRGLALFALSYPYLLPLTPPCLLSLPGPLGLFWSLRKPWEPSEVFNSLGSLVRLKGLAPLHPLSLPLASLAP